jgi:hypothetical protein
MAATTERKGECGGVREKCSLADCPKFGTLGREDRNGRRRVKGCGDPAARGKRNRTKGDSKARRARRVLGISGANSRHEEHWGGGLVRVEVKAGAQVSPIATRFDAARSQSEAQRPLGDVRPFAMIAMPDGRTNGIVLMALEDFAVLIEAAQASLR